MPPYPHEARLRSKAADFITILQQASYEAGIQDRSIREYSLKIAVVEAGKAIGSINLYYSPKRNEFTCRSHQITRKASAEQIDKLWNDWSGVAVTPPPAAPAKGYQAYVDGSFYEGRVGFGAVVLKDGEILQTFSGRVHEDLESRQVAGELVATMTVVEWAQREGLSQIEIFYDYTGIEKWARGQWKANKDLTQRYARFMKESPLRIKWHKVISHTGNHYNEMADQLAKKGSQTA